MRFGSTAKVLAKCKLKYYRISERLSLVRTDLSSVLNPALHLLPALAKPSLLVPSEASFEFAAPSQPLQVDLHQLRTAIAAQPVCIAANPT